MNNAQSALKVAAGIFLTIALITIVVLLFVSAQEATKTAQNEFSSIQTELSKASFTVYDNTTVSGSQVVNAIRKFYKQDQFGVRVITGKNKSNGITEGTYYGSDVLDNGTISSAKRNESLELATQESLESYVNPSGKFKARVIVDQSNVTRGIVFDQQ
ncbi:ABC transporter permease [Paenibacillus thiaminolyticus]|uniref:ABC transporter permease n=1 Tax=Paenibacillus thiaminolyticus TaxID=49283 RepID=UPI001162BA21|nr:ABC transporter permease [Paenibacillus thiaminolyticus]NGP59833.1 ABC transporter permease [Paenibacillus thiaminolyticus]WCR28008.1 ABC transporter permease [Paenibacillus thiaminolyticus]